MLSLASGMKMSYNKNMFKKTSKTRQLNIFSSAHSLLKGRALKEYEDKQKWHNQFRVQVTERIDEEIFRPLFCEDFGAPNSSISILTGMMILKEAQGWSDSQLFEQCQYNLLVRSALGLPNIDDSIPAASTYYLLRKRIVEREKEGQENLLEKVFVQVTKSQAIEFEINGNKIRMDSKLLGSNIAWYSRYELIHETVRKFYKQYRDKATTLLSESEISILERIIDESGDKIVYRSNKSEIETKTSELGVLIYKIINLMKDHTSDVLQTLSRVFNDQYEVVEGTVVVRPKQEIKAVSVQSPHDTDCHYRKKDDNQKKGYSINIAETCDTTDKPNLITNVIVDTASAADCKHLQPAIEATHEVIHGPIETVNADGAYHSVENQEYCQNNNIDLIVSAISGTPSRYDLEIDQNNELIVTDTQTNTIVPTRKVETRKEDAQPKWAIRTDDNRHRYFTKKEIDACLLRKQIAARTREELNVRNNVEASIFQLGYHYSNDKSRYRGLIKHKMWANARCLWINFVRILKFTVSTRPDYTQGIPNYVQNNILLLFYQIIVSKYVKYEVEMLLVKKFRLIFPKISFSMVS